LCYRNGWTTISEDQSIGKNAFHKRCVAPYTTVGAAQWKPPSELELPYFNRYLAKKAFYGFHAGISALIWPYFHFRHRFFQKNQARILMYHCVSDFPREKDIPYDNVPPSLFRLHMDILLADHFNVISLGTLAGILKAGEDIPPRTIVVSFDDGYKNNYLNALPILEERRFKASFFVIVGEMGRNEPFNHLLWDGKSRTYYRDNPESRLPINKAEVREIRELGHDIGSHGMTHRSIGNLSYGEGWKEILRSKAILEETVAAPVSLFSYPFGSRSYNDFNPQTEAILRQTGYDAACTAEIGAVSKKSELYQLTRIPVRETDTHFRFRQKLMGAFEWIAPFRKAFQKNVTRIDNVL
jgi:peptidoglycan/xylan/chitin deacetylase (PgdA/CDA1 family)